MRRMLQLPRPKISAPLGMLHALGRLDYAYMTESERDAHQSAYRSFLLAVLGPLVFTYAQRSRERFLFLRMRDDEGNRQALHALPVPQTEIAALTPAWLRTAIALPGLGPLSEPAGGRRLSPLPPQHALPRIALRERLRVLEGGTGFRQVLSVETFPQLVDELSLERLWRQQEDLVCTLRLLPLPPREAQRVLERRLIGLQSTSALRRQRGGAPDAEVEQAREDALALRAALVEGRERLFSTSVLCSVEGQTREGCESAASLLREILAEAGFGLHVLLGSQWEGARWLLPEFTPREPPGRLLSAASLSCLSLLPAGPPRTDGQEVGRHLHDGTSVRRRRETSPNPLELVLGAPGFGKSASMKAELLRARPRHLLVVDPEGEYGPIVRHLGGEDAGPGPCPAKSLGELLTQDRPIAWNLRGEHPDRLAATLLAAAAAALAAAERLVGREPLWVALDEAHLWLGDPGTCRTLLDLAKRARKRGLLLTLVSQNVGDFLQSDAGQRILANAGRLLLFRQQATDCSRLSEVLRLSGRASDFIRRAPPGEALLIDDIGPVPVRVELSEEELGLVDTRPRFARPG